MHLGSYIILLSMYILLYLIVLFTLYKDKMIISVCFCFLTDIPTVLQYSIANTITIISLLNPSSPLGGSRSTLEAELLKLLP